MSKSKKMSAPPMGQLYPGVDNPPCNRFCLSTTRILFWCGACNDLSAIMGNLLLQKWGIPWFSATLGEIICTHLVKRACPIFRRISVAQFFSGFREINLFLIIRWVFYCLKHLSKRGFVCAP